MENLRQATKADIAKIFKFFEPKFEEISATLKQHSMLLNEHSKVLNEHSKVLHEQPKVLGEFSTKITRLAVLYEEMNSKIEVALEVHMVTNHELSAKNHERRLSNVETDLNVLKVAFGRPKK